MRRKSLPKHSGSSPLERAANLWIRQNAINPKVKARDGVGDYRKLEDAGWREWVTSLFPQYVTHPFGQRHADLWDWCWAVTRDARPRPFIGVWPRGGGKSTTAELVAAAFGIKLLRNYALYVSETQEQADKHVATIGSAFESVGIDRAVNKYGASRGWRRNRLHTSTGFIVDALGLDVAARGIKVEANRPGLIVLDDLDSLNDSSLTVRKKVGTLTATILPTGSNDCAILGMQNLIHSGSIFSMLASGKADFLSDRIVSGPFRAIDDFNFEQTPSGIKITSGTATWEGQDLVACEGFIRTWGLTAFNRECQQLTEIESQGALWRRDWLNMFRVMTAPPMARVVIAIDPSVTSKETSDEAGVIAAGRGFDKHGYLLGDYSMRATPAAWATRSVSAYVIHGADCIIGEGNNGGEMIETVIRGISQEAVAEDLERIGEDPTRAISGKQVAYKMVHASRAKQTRAEPVSTRYERGTVHHVGMFPALETEFCTWVPGIGTSPNRLDAAVWAFTDLIVGGSGWVDLAAGNESPIEIEERPHDDFEGVPIQ